MNGGMCLHVDSAGVGNHGPDASRRRVYRQAHIGFMHEIDALFDAETMNWPSHHGGAVEPRDDPFDLLRRACALNSAGFAPAAGQGLRLDHEGTTRQLPRTKIAA